MFEGVTLPAGFNKVEADRRSEILSKSGSRSGVYFFAGDTIVIGGDDDLYSCIRKIKANGKEEDRTIPYVACTINGNKPTLVPLSAFRNFPVVDTDKFFERHPAMKALYNGSDRERFDVIKGKTIKVTALEDGQAFDFAQCDFANRKYVYKTSRFAVFEF